MIRSKILFFFLTVLALNVTAAWAQNRSITIRLNSPTTFQEHITYVISNTGPDGQLIRYKNTDVIYKKVMRNKAYPTHLKKKQNVLLLTAEQQYRIWDTVDSLYDIYSHRATSKVSINAKQHAAYYKMLDSIYATPEAVFTVKNPRRVLDGLYYQVTVKDKGKQKRYHVNTPNAQLHPLLSRFMAATNSLLNVNVLPKSNE